MPAETDAQSIARRRLVLRDSLLLVSLVLATAVLFTITLFLFRSFSAHRAGLARRWSARGRESLQAGRPEEAIAALQTALSYAPGTPAYEELLAQALGAAGRTEESYNYFMGLWAAEPGSGTINLQLARLAARRNDRSAAVNFYRASIYGTWEGDGVARRAAVRLELARYLIAAGDPAAARMELLIAGGNAPETYARDMALGDLLQQADDPADARSYYRKAAAARPGDAAPIEAEGRTAYQTGDYESAYRLLARALAERAARHATAPQDADDSRMMGQAARILELDPLPKLPANQRVARILAARTIARRRLNACSAQLGGGPAAPQDLQSLATRWAGPDGTSRAATLLNDPARQSTALQLAYDTEIEASKLCGAPTGDDALLLRMAVSSIAMSPLEGARAEQAAAPHDWR